VIDVVKFFWLMFRHREQIPSSFNLDFHLFLLFVC
jgi:hypothetical protein